MLISEIIKFVKNENFLLGIKLENVNFIERINVLKIYYYFKLIKEYEKIKIIKLLNSEIKFVDESKFEILPFPVRNSKFNNFVILFNGKKIYFYRKNNIKKIEIYEHFKSPINEIKKITLKKLPFLEENYKYLQIVFPWDSKEKMKKLYDEWNLFREEKNIKKFVGDIYFSYFMEVGYEPS